jgi:hypothetical protein
MTFLKDDTGTSSATVIYANQTSTLTEIVGDGSRDLILAHGDNIAVLASSSVASTQIGGNLEVVVQGSGDVIVTNPNVHNSAFFNEMTSPQAMTYDLTGLVTHNLTVNGQDLSGFGSSVALYDGPEIAHGASGATTYMYGIDAIYGTDSGDTFIGGTLTNGENFGQEFYAGNGANTVVDIGYGLNQQYGNQYFNSAVTVSYAESTSGITVQMGDPAMHVVAHDVTAYLDGYVFHGTATDMLYGVQDIQGSAHNDVFHNYGESGILFHSSLGDDSYSGDGNAADTEVSYEDSGSAVTINLSGSTTNGLANGQAIHDGTYIDSLSCIEQVRLASDYSGKLYGDGSVTLDMSSTNFDGMTANLSSGKVYGWEAGVTDSFSNIGALKDQVGGSDFVVTTTNLATESIIASYGDSTLDLSQLTNGVTAFLANQVMNGHDIGEALLISNASTAVLSYGVENLYGSYLTGIGSHDYGNGTGFDLTTACLVSSPTTDVQVDFSTGMASFNGTSYHLVGNMPNADNVTGFYLDDAVSTFTLKGSLDQLSNAGAEVYDHNALSGVPTVVLEVTSNFDVSDDLFADYTDSNVGGMTVKLDEASTVTLESNAANANLELVDFHIGSGNTIDASYDNLGLNIHLSGTENLVNGNCENDTLDLTGGSLSNVLTDGVTNMETLRADDATTVDLTGIVPTLSSDGFQNIDFSHNTLAMTVTANLGDLSGMSLAGGSNGENQLIVTDTTYDPNDVTVILTETEFLSAAEISGSKSNDIGLIHLVVADSTAPIDDSAFSEHLVQSVMEYRLSGVISVEFERDATLTMGTNAQASGPSTVTMDGTGTSSLDVSDDSNLYQVMDYWGYLHYQGFDGTNSGQSHTVMLGYNNLSGDVANARTDASILNVYVDYNSAVGGVNSVSEAALDGNFTGFQTAELFVYGFDMVTASLGSGTAAIYPNVYLDLQDLYAGAYLDLSNYTKALQIQTADPSFWNGQNLGMEYITVNPTAVVTVTGSSSDNLVLSVNADLMNYEVTDNAGNVELSNTATGGAIILQSVHMIHMADGAYAVSSAEDTNVSLQIDAETGITGLIAGAGNLTSIDGWSLDASVQTSQINGTQAWSYLLNSETANGSDTIVFSDSSNPNHSFTLSVGYDPGGWNAIGTETVTSDLTLHDGAHVNIEVATSGSALNADQLAVGGNFTAGGDLHLNAMTSDTPQDSASAAIMTMTSDSGTFAHITGLDAYASSSIALELDYSQSGISVTAHSAILSTLDLVAYGTEADYIVGCGNGIAQTLSGGGGADEILAVGSNNEVIVGDNSFKYLDGSGTGSELEFAFSNSGTIDLTGSGVVTAATATGGQHRSDSVEHFDLLDLTNSHGSTLVLNEAAVYSIANTGTNALLAMPGIARSTP